MSDASNLNISVPARDARTFPDAEICKVFSADPADIGCPSRAVLTPLDHKCDSCGREEDGFCSYCGAHFCNLCFRRHKANPDAHIGAPRE
jgi:hypothetical protein